MWAETFKQKKIQIYSRHFKCLQVLSLTHTHTWFRCLKLSRRCSAPRWFIKASAVCLCNIMALNLSLPQYCHNGNMCVVIYLNASDIIAGPPPSTSYTNTHMHTYIHASTLWCTYTRWLCLYSLVHSFEEPPPLNGWLNIFRSNNLSQVLRVALVSRLRTRCLV